MVEHRHKGGGLCAGRTVVIFIYGRKTKGTSANEPSGVIH
jgi:hypothetical protein